MQHNISAATTYIWPTYVAWNKIREHLMILRLDLPALRKLSRSQNHAAVLCAGSCPNFSSTALSAAQSAIRIHRIAQTLTTVPPLFAKPVTRMLDIIGVSNSGHSLGALCRTTFPSSSSSPPSAIFSSLGGSSSSAPWIGHWLRILSGRKLPQCCLSARDMKFRLPVEEPA